MTGNCKIDKSQIWEQSQEMISNTNNDSGGSFRDEKKTAETLDWHLSAKLYDREAQINALKDAYLRQRKKRSPEFVLITGSSGVGKSALARSIRSRVEDDWGYFISGKFDQIQKPQAPFFAAVEEFIKQVHLRGEHVVEEVKAAIRKEVGAEASILLESIPQLSDLISKPKDTAKGNMGLDNEDGETSSDDDSEFKVGISDNHTRFNGIFCRFIRAICANDRHLILLLDDLQWADSSSLEVLSILLDPMMDPIEGLMVMGTCRGNEVGKDADLSVMLRDIEDRGTTITEIKAGNLDINGLCAMISNALELSTKECMPLAEIVLSQTEGNVFFAKQYIRSLIEESILYRDNDTRKWIWDETALILALPSAPKGDLVLQLLAQKLRQLPSDVIETVKVISCLGSKFSEDILFHTGCVVSSQILLALEVAAEHGFIVYNVNSGVGHFTHDKFREAAYSLIPIEERAKFHLSVGRNLWRQLSIPEVKQHIILIVNQLEQGVKYVNDPDERDSFARLFLRASRAAARCSAFSVALNYVNVGIGLLSSRHWRDQYNLSLDLYCTGTELAFCNGKHDQVDAFAEEVIKNARSFGDKNRAIMAQAASCSSKGEVQKGMKICLDALSELKCPYPKRPSKLRIRVEFLMIRQKLRRMREEDIKSLPKLEDLRATASMQIIFVMVPLFVISDLELSPLPALRLIKLTLRYGLSPFAALGFLFYAVCLVRVGDFEDAYRFGQLANHLLQLFPSRQLEPKLGYLYWACSQTLKEPYRAVLDPIWKYHQLGLKYGDIEMAFVAATFHCTFRLFLGDQIEEVVQVLAQTEERCRVYNQLKVQLLTRAAMQVCANFQGLAVNPLILTGEFMNEGDVMKMLADKNLQTPLSIILHLKYFIATFTNQNEYADSLYRANKEHYKDFMKPMFTVHRIFYRGLVAAALARECRGRFKRLKVAEAESQFKKLHKLLIHCPENTMNKLSLIEAELEFCRNRYSAALLKYNKSIFYAEREGYTGQQALACEKAGIMLKHAGRESEASLYFAQARSLYLAWGAKVKVDQLDKY